MKGYIFILGKDPYHGSWLEHKYHGNYLIVQSEGIYTDFNKAFKRLLELNHQYFHEFYGEIFSEYGVITPEMQLADKKNNLDLLDKLEKEWVEQNEIAISHLFINKTDPQNNFYSLIEIEINS